MQIKLIMLNFSPIEKQLPASLFQSLREECLNVSEETNTPLTNTLSKKGIVKHYLVNKNRQALKAYVNDLAKEYMKENEQALDVKFKMDGIVPNGLIPQTPWINIQKKTEHLPNHDHAGFCSYTIWVNIPEESKFEFVYNSISGEIFRHVIRVDKNKEGTIMMFPSKLVHCVYPFYNSDEPRISVSGNINLINENDRAPKWN